MATVAGQETRTGQGPLAGQVAIVTGASRGIGTAIARELGAHGAHLIVNYATSAGPAEALVQELTANGQGVEAIAVQADVGVEDQARALIAQAHERFGRLDILVNNAGITRDKTMRRMTGDDWRQVVETNLNSAFYCAHAAMGHMIAQERGKIINIGSIIGLSGNIGQANYAAAKAGMIGFTKSLALELARYGITVNCVAPGYVATEMVMAVPEEIREKIIARIPLKRLGTVEEIAKSVRYLCVDGDYITGATLNINGGLYLQ
ncbi:MAG: beta-ketoacyl-ACP reductase [Chloroflexota bacterium]|nr:beta-ketoacyl-ACP reductase [Chloroflexota bacterium]